MIQSRLESQGYRNDENNPDLIVRWKVFDNPLVLRGYEQPQLRDWLLLNSVALATQSNEVDRDSKDHYNEISYDFKKGMFLISFIDVRENRLVWQGYFSEAIRNNNDRRVKWTTGRILDGFNIIPQAYLIKRSANKSTIN